MTKIRRSPEYVAAYGEHVATLPRLYELMHDKHELKRNVDRELNELLAKRADIWKRIIAADSQERLRHAGYR